MNWLLLLPLLITTVVAIVGWFFAHGLAVARDRANKRRDQRVRYLVELFHRLSKAWTSDSPSHIAEAVKSAVIDIQLLGSQTQIRRVEQFLNELRETRRADFGLLTSGLMDDLRQDLREELSLPKVEGTVGWIEIEEVHISPKKT